MKFKRHRFALCNLILVLILSACFPAPSEQFYSEQATTEAEKEENQEVILTALPTRPVYQPGELVSYIVQTGDTLPALAAHFNTTVQEIQQENSVLPESTTTLPAGLPLQIPIYYQPLWGSAYQIMPDCLYTNGPAQLEFDVIQYVNEQSGWFKNYNAYTGSKTRTGGELIDYISNNYSISPRLLLAILEYQTEAISNPLQPDFELERYPLGIEDKNHQGLYQQLLLAANTLNNGYYGWRTGLLKQFELEDGTLVVPDPWQNASSIALQVYFGQSMFGEAYDTAIHANGLARTYQELFGDLWSVCDAHIPGSLTQPQFILPFENDNFWAYTGGPHTAWGDGQPLAAIDFAPPNIEGGCVPTDQYATAVADGLLIRKDTAIAVLDLDEDGNEQTGWVIFYLHLATDSIPPVGTRLSQGDRIGLPSCEGGRSTGTHVHIARKYNGEWITADSPLPFVLDGWAVVNGDSIYQGYLEKFGRRIIASEAGDQKSHINRLIE